MALTSRETSANDWACVALGLLTFAVVSTFWFGVVGWALGITDSAVWQ